MKPTYRCLLSLVFTAPLIVVLAACGGMDAGTSPIGPGPGGSVGGGGNVGGGSGGGGNLGATTGGAQDFRQVRQAIEQGQVPQADQLYVEGLLAEHDLPLAGPACTQLLCLNFAAGLTRTRFESVPDGAQAATDGRTVLVQIGMSSGLKAETFRRRPLNIALVVDVSGSMEGHKMSDTRYALEQLVERLDEGDMVSIVAFSSAASLRLAPTRGDKKATIRAAIATLQATGSTNMEAGLTLGYQQLAQHHDVSAEGRSSRLMLFTDARPNVGATHAGSFTGLVTKAAADGIGLTAFGVGIDFNAQLIDLIANLRGGNYFYLADSAAIRTVFDKDFDYLVTPLAYDLELQLKIPAGFRFVAAHGVSWNAASDFAVLKVPTVFLSRNKGAMLVELERTSAPLAGSAGDVAVLTGVLSYELPAGALQQDQLAATLARAAFSNADESYSQPAVRRAVALVSEVNGMKEACRRYWAGDKDGARGLLGQIETLLSAHQSALGDSSLAAEIALVAKLRSNIK
jgi:Ca-activated chloride channel family protein